MGDKILVEAYDTKKGVKNGKLSSCWSKTGKLLLERDKFSEGY